MSTYERNILSRITLLEARIQNLSEGIAAGAPRWDDTTGLAIDSSILAVCGLLWGFTSILHETSNRAEAR